MSDSNISFEHFDPELELGNLDENGRPIRPRKKPGRKPNPPSPAQRKAQNRAAQRAFRERKRREMREAESTVKKCMYARDQAIRQSRRLQRRIDELTYETNYLKGYTLTLKMACIANQVDVPKFWDTGVTDDIGADELTFSKTKGIPQQLEFFLDKKLNIISIDQQKKEDTMSDNDLPPSSILSCSSPSSSFLVNESVAGSPLSSSPDESSYTSMDDSQDDFDLNNALSSIAPQLASHLETPFFQKLLNTDLVGTNPLGETKTIAPLSPSPASMNDPTQLPSVFEEEENTLFDKKTGVARSITIYTADTDDTSSNSSSGSKKVFPPMTPLDAISQMRAIKNLDKDTRALFIPTELQRTIRHDTRIDVVPGAALRDHMILFQDFYDANELFDYLAESSVFLGGELGNLDSWFVPPNFFKKYWFLCPNHKTKRVDNAVEIMVYLGKRMIQLMIQRKQMYIERDLYADYFPDPTVEQEIIDVAFLQTDEQQHLDNIMYNQQVQDIFAMDEDDMDLADLPLDHFISMINASIPQSFTA